MHVKSPVNNTLWTMTYKNKLCPGPDPALRMSVLIFRILVTFCIVTKYRTLGDSSKPAVEVNHRNQIKLYYVLRHFALPDLDHNSNIQQRFILQVPGKVLNPTDFYPGQEYIDYLQSPESHTTRVDIPPQVMEKMFNLVDAIPCAHPVVGKTTTYSLAKLYESVLENIDQIGFDDLDEQAKNKYYEALDKLVELVSDPDKSSKQLTLFDLYTKLQKTYHDEQQKMERTLREKSTQLEAAQYQVWLERNYQMLDTQVDTAYKRWLLYGRKHLTESYLVHLHVTSSEKLLEKARLVFKLSGFMSHDWSQKVYPVSLSPPTWFKYLNKSTFLTRDQLEAKHEDLKSRIALLENMRKRSTDKIQEKQLRVVQQDCDKRQKNIWLKSEELEYMRKRCWLMFDSYCDIWKKEQEVKDALSELTAANFKLQMLNWKFGENSTLKEEIEAVLMKLRYESNQLQEQLMNGVSSTLPPLVVDIESNEELTEEEIQDQWQHFEFSSTREYELSESISKLFDFYSKPSSSSKHHTFVSSVENANVFLKAKLLKVNINRPWFRESIFHYEEFKLSEKNKLVSPGYMKEAEFYNEVTKETPDGSPPYLLYQYPTAFLLAKDITMEFTELSDENKQAALLSSYGYSSKGNYGPISFGGSFTASGLYNHIQVSLLANGVKVYIPSAQIIGYYCDIIPKFPNTINLTESDSEQELSD